MTEPRTIAPSNTNFFHQVPTMEDLSKEEVEIVQPFHIAEEKSYLDLCPITKKLIFEQEGHIPFHDTILGKIFSSSLVHLISRYIPRDDWLNVALSNKEALRSVMTSPTTLVKPRTRTEKLDWLVETLLNDHELVYAVNISRVPESAYYSIHFFDTLKYPVLNVRVYHHSGIVTNGLDEPRGYIWHPNILNQFACLTRSQIAVLVGVYNLFSERDRFILLDPDKTISKKRKYGEEFETMKLKVKEDKAYEMFYAQINKRQRLLQDLRSNTKILESCLKITQDAQHLPKIDREQFEELKGLPFQ